MCYVWLYVFTKYVLCTSTLYVVINCLWGAHVMPLLAAGAGDKFTTQGHMLVKAQRRSDGGPAAPLLCDSFAEAQEPPRIVNGRECGKTLSGG